MLIIIRQCDVQCLSKWNTLVSLLHPWQRWGNVAEWLHLLSKCFTLCVLFSNIFKVLSSSLSQPYLLFLSSTCPNSKPHGPRVTMTFTLWPRLGVSHQPLHRKGADLDHWDVTCSISLSLFCAHTHLKWHHNPNTHHWTGPDSSDRRSPDPLQTLQRSLLGTFHTTLIITL